MQEAIELNEFIKQQKKPEPYIPKLGERIVSIAEYSEMTGMSPSTIRFRLNQGRLAGFKTGKKWNIKIASEEQSSLTAENERLRLENEALKMQLSCIRSILAQ